MSYAQHLPPAFAGSWRWSGRGPGPSTPLRRLVELLLRWQDRAAQRRALAELDARLLADIGVSREGVLRECGKPVWRP